MNLCRAAACTTCRTVGAPTCEELRAAETVTCEMTPGFDGRRGRLEVQRFGGLTLTLLQGIVQGAELLGVPPLADVTAMSVRADSSGEVRVALDWAL